MRPPHDWSVFGPEGYARSARRIRAFFADDCFSRSAAYFCIGLCWSMLFVGTMGVIGAVVILAPVWLPGYLARKGPDSEEGR
jgi:hypothetical protein